MVVFFSVSQVLLFLNGHFQSQSYFRLVPSSAQPLLTNFYYFYQKYPSILNIFPLSVKQPREGCVRGSHLPSEESRRPLPHQEHELLQEPVRRGRVPHRPRTAALRGSPRSIMLYYLQCINETHKLHLV